MRRVVMLYGVVSYFIFFLTLVYFIGFVGDIFVPVSLSSDAKMDGVYALLINISLILLWGVQHTVMARGWFKEKISWVIPHPIERSTYVLVSSLVLVVFMFYWQPMEGIVWQVDNTFLVGLLWGLFSFSWILMLIATFLTDHFDLFGLRQSWLYFLKKTYTPVVFTEVLFYRWIRHPMMLGFFISFWALPTMTVGHLLFSVGMSIYVVVGMYFEEKSLVKLLGKPYKDYQQRTAKILPKVY